MQGRPRRQPSRNTGIHAALLSTPEELMEDDRYA